MKAFTTYQTTTQLEIFETTAFWVEYYKEKTFVETLKHGLKELVLIHYVKGNINNDRFMTKGYK